MEIPLAFAHNPNLRKSKLLDLSPNKTRVVGDIGGGLPVTLSSMSAKSELSDDSRTEHYILSPYNIQKQEL
jgi:hypothetical protein